MLIRLWLSIFLVVLALPLFGKEGTFVNPITDICWECVFPITVSGVNVTPGKHDQTNYSQKICACPGTPPKVGIPITFFEPAMMVDVTRHAYKLMGLGGVSVGKESVKNRGTVGIIADGTTKTSFYHVHLYTYPILAILEVLTDFSTCIEKKEVEVAYMSELDPMWNDDNLSLIVNPEAGFFGTRLAHTACFADCASSSAGNPKDKLFWCAGCEGSLYPFSGTVSHHVGGIQASYLLVNRVLAKMHRSLFLKGFDEGEYCEAKSMPYIKKSLYKTQLIYPVPQTSGACHPLGKSDLLWGSNKSYPYGGEDFVYLIWQKRQCCLDAVKPAIGGRL